MRIPPSSDCLLLVALVIAGGLVRALAPGVGESRTEAADSVREARGPRPDIAKEGVDRSERLGALDPFVDGEAASSPCPAGPAASDSSAIEEPCKVPRPVDEGDVYIRDAGWLWSGSSARCSLIRVTDSPSTPSAGIRHVVSEN